MPTEKTPAPPQKNPVGRPPGEPAQNTTVRLRDKDKDKAKAIAKAATGKSNISKGIQIALDQAKAPK